MFLRNKLAIFSFTLMSLMTIPTLAENDTSTVNSRIETANFDVQIKTPEGWSETKDFNQAIPETIKIDNQIFHGLQFNNGAESYGCAVFFAEESWDEDDSNDNVSDNSALIEAHAKAHELAFPGTNLSTFTVSKVSFEGSLGADITAETAKIDLKGAVEGNLSNESGDASKFTITGTLYSDTTKDNFAVGTGKIIVEGAMPLCGTTAVKLGNDYQIIILIWGTDEESQLRDTHRFLEAISVKAKAPAEIVAEAT
jgi:hypothetical protein